MCGSRAKCAQLPRNMRTICHPNSRSRLLNTLKIPHPACTPRLSEVMSSHYAIFILGGQQSAYTKQQHSHLQSHTLARLVSAASYRSPTFRQRCSFPLPFFSVESRGRVLWLELLFPKIIVRQNDDIQQIE